MRTTIAAIALAFAVTVPAVASAQSQASAASPWEFVASSGALLPTGSHRDAIKRGAISTAQLSFLVHPAVAITGAFGWARSRDAAMVGRPKLDVFTYDAGVEGRSPRMAIGTMGFTSFVGVGAGARSYNYRSLDVDATHNAAAYASVGGEAALGIVRLRLEARDYVTGFKPLTGAGASDTRNDVVVLAGLRFVRR